jgi:hypothetical protein
VSDADVATLRDCFDAWNVHLDEHLAYYADDAVHVTAADWPEAGEYHGKPAIRDLWHHILTGQEAQEIILDEAVPLTGRRVLTTMRWRFRGPRSQVTGDLTAYAIWTLREALIVRVEYFMDHDAAREAAAIGS